MAKGKYAEERQNTEDSAIKVKATNADRIRAMTDEKLAEWIYPYAVENFPEKYCNEGCKEDNIDCCINGCLLHWLKKEVEG